MNRKKEFNKAVIKPIRFADSRFGIRKMYMTEQSKEPKKVSYMNPGRGWWGTD